MPEYNPDKTPFSPLTQIAHFNSQYIQQYENADLNPSWEFNQQMREAQSIKPPYFGNYDAQIPYGFNRAQVEFSPRIQDSFMRSPTSPPLYRPDGNYEAEGGMHFPSEFPPGMGQPKLMRKPFFYNRKFKWQSIDGREPVSEKVSRDGVTKRYRSHNPHPRRIYSEYYTPPSSYPPVFCQRPQPASPEVMAWNERFPPVRPSYDAVYSAGLQAPRHSPYAQEMYSPYPEAAYVEPPYHYSRPEYGFQDVNGTAVTPPGHFQRKQYIPSDMPVLPEHYGMQLTRSGHFPNQLSPPSNFYHNSPALPQAGQDDCWVTKSSNGGKQSATLLTPNSICGSPSGKSLKSAAAGSFSDSEPAQIEDRSPEEPNKSDEQIEAFADANSSTSSVELKKKKRSSSKSKKKSSSKSSKDSSSDKIADFEFDFKRYGLSKKQSTTFKRIFEKQLEMLYRAVTEEFNGRAGKTQIGIEFVLSYLQNMEAEDFLPERIAERAGLHSRHMH